MKISQLTPRQAEILAFIVRCWKRGYIPTIRQVGAKFDMTPNGVACHLKALRTKGYIGHQGERGSIRLTKRAMGTAKC